MRDPGDGIKRKAKKKPYSPPASFRSDAAQRTGARTPKPKRPAAAPTQRGLRNAVAQGGGFEPELRAARGRTEAAQRRLPARPVPHVPVLADPTPRQTQAAKRAIVQHVIRAAGTGGTRRQVQERRDEVVRQLGQSATGRRLIAAGRHYAAAEQRHLSAQGVPQRNARDRVAAGRAHTRLAVPGIPAASIDVTALGRGALGATSLGKSGSAETRFVRRVGGDLAALGALPFVGGYQIGKATYEATPIRKALGGSDPNLKPAKKLAVGMAEGIKQEVSDPGKAFSEHPLLTALDAAGGLSVAGRLTGAGLRAAGSTTKARGVRGAAARAGSTVRPPLALTQDPAGGHISRTYSKDSTRKAAQVAADRTHEPLRHPDGTPVTVVDRGRRVPVLAPATELGRKHLASRRGDMLAGRANSRERLIRERAAAERTVRTRAGAKVRNTVTSSEAVGVKGRHTRDVVALAVQGGVTSAKHFAADLGRYADRLDAEHAARIGAKGFRHSGEARLNRANARLARRVLDDPKALAQSRAIVAEAERHGRALNAADVKKAAAGIDELPRMRRAALEVPALEHMGARHFTVKEHAQLERHAGVVEAEARKAYDAAKTPAARRAAAVSLNAVREHRIAVSGRPPERVRAHENARTAHRDAQGKARKAAAAQRRAEARVRALTDRHRSERGREGIVAAYYVRETRFATRKAAAAYAKRAGVKPSAIRRVATSPAEAKRVGDLSQARLVVKNARAARREAEAAARKAQHAVRENPLPDIQAAIRYGETSRAAGFDMHPGEHLPNEHIEDFLRSRGRDPETVAYLPHRGDVVGRRAYHAQLRPGTRPLDKPEVRTGESYRKGATETSAELIRDQGVRQQVQLNKANEIDRMIADHGMRHPAWAKAQAGEQLTAGEKRAADAGGYFTAKEALEAAARVAQDSGEYVVPVRAHAAALSENTRHVIRENLQGPGGMDSVGQRMLNDRVVTDGDISGRARNVVLMSGHLFDRLNNHLRPAGQLQKFAQVLNRAFRFAVLPQPRWLTGNFMEPYVVRLTASGSGVNVLGLGVDIAKSKGLLKRMKASGDPKVRQAAADMEAQGLGGLFVGQRGASNRRGLQDFPTLDQTVQKAYGGVVSKLPVMESFGQTTRWLLKSGASAAIAPLKLFFVVNRGIERGAQHAAIGGMIRDDIQQFTGSWIQTLKTGEKAWQEAQAGMINTPTQHRLLDQAHELLGKYDSWSPMMRAVVQGPAPFLPWMLNAVRFVYWTMPVHHTIVNDLLIKAEQVVEKDWKELHADTPPGSLRQAIPNGKGGWIDLARYAPYGATVPIVEGDLQGVTNQFYPQATGAVSALKGTDPFGRALKVQPTAANPTGEASGADKTRIAANQTLEALVPYLATSRRLQEGGRTAYSDSTVLHPRTKPGTDHGMSALRRVFDPFRPTYLRAALGGPVSVEEAWRKREAALERRGSPAAADAIEEAWRRREQRIAAGR